MTQFDVTMTHTEKTFESLSRMQYDLFCVKNRIARSVISLTAILIGIVNFSEWWGILLAGYGCYLTTSTYSSANHTAHKLAGKIKESGMPFPSSRYIFRDKELQIFSMPANSLESTLAYSDIVRLGEDQQYFYIFCTQFGGYMLPKSALANTAEDFRTFLEEKTNQVFRSRTAPAVRLLRRIQRH